MIELRMAPAGDPAVAEFLEERGMAVIARRAQLVDAPARPAMAAIQDDELVGVLSYELGPIECEILTLYVSRQWTGIGSALLRAVADVATAAGCRRCWLVTTNDNVDALRFYQRRGFRLTGIRCGAVDEARQSLKPSIPLAGEYGIPLRDELELARDLTPQPLWDGQRGWARSMRRAWDARSYDRVFVLMDELAEQVLDRLQRALPDEQRGTFAQLVARRLGDPVTVDTVRLNIDARRG